jgi:DNA helicase IV
VLVVQGGPGTGKTVVALHRAAYLLYTYRFPLEDQGVLVLGPNRVFLRYIERVLPSLGEAGVELAVLADLVPDVEWGGTDGRLAARVKSDRRMAQVIDKAVRDRERALREPLAVPFRSGFLRLTVDDSARIVRAARRRYRRHNAGRRFVEQEVWAALAASSRIGPVTSDEVKDEVRHHEVVRAALERMWPVLTPAQLLHDLYGSPALLKLAAASWFSAEEFESMYRARLADVADVRWSDADVALLDEARAVLGARSGKTKADEVDEIRTYGHIVIDEVQDLTPMQLRMVTRRSLNGSMTIVGDLAQATGPWAPESWDAVLADLPTPKGARVVGLSIGYRIPGVIMELATKVMMAATPSLRIPTSVRQGDQPPLVVDAREAGLGEAVAIAVKDLLADVGDGNVAVVVPDQLADAVAGWLAAAGIDHGRATRTALAGAVTVVPMSVVKGLEMDGVVVVEPGRIVSEQPQGLRALYVALTRSTKRLTVVHAEPLPPAMVS